MPGIPDRLRGPGALRLGDGSGNHEPGLPCPAAGQWAADASNGVRWTVSDLEVQLDPQWQKMIDAGWQPPDIRGGRRGRVRRADDAPTQRPGRLAALRRDSGRIGPLARRVRERARLRLEGSLVGCEWFNPASYGSCANDVAKTCRRRRLPLDHREFRPSSRPRSGDGCGAR